MITTINWTTPEDNGAAGDGVTDDTAAFQAALDTELHVLAMGQYAIDTTNPLVMATNGQKLQFGNPSVSGLTPLAGDAGDILRVGNGKHMQVIDGSILVRANQVGLRVFAGFSRFNNLHVLPKFSGDNQTSTGIIISDNDPSSSTVLEAYTNIFDGVIVGADGKTFAYAIDSDSTVQGQNYNKIINSTVFGDNCIRLDKGVGNIISNNRFISATSSGHAVDLGTAVSGAYVFGNSCIGHTADIYLNNTSNTSNLLFTDSANVKYGAGTTTYNYKDGFQDMVFTANNQQHSPIARLININGSGASRTGCSLGSGLYNGQEITLRALSYPVTLINNPSSIQTAYFSGNAGSVTLGNTSGQILTMTLVWDTTYPFAGGQPGAWFEKSRSLV